METLTDELWHWQWIGAKCESKKSVSVSICPYSEIHKERIRNLDSQHFMFSFVKKKKAPQPGTSTEKSNICTILQSKNINARALQWGLQNFRSGLQTYHSKRTKFNFFISLNVVGLFYINLTDLYLWKCCFYISSIYCIVLNIIILHYLCKFWEGAGM